MDKVSSATLAGSRRARLPGARKPALVARPGGNDQGRRPPRAEAPEHIRSVNGPEFIAKTIRAWLERGGVAPLCIEPGSPWENPYIESFNGKLKDELINGELFTNLLEAKVLTKDHQGDYKEIGPHGALGRLAPAEFARRWKAEKIAAAEKRGGETTDLDARRWAWNSHRSLPIIWGKVTLVLRFG